MQILNEIMFTEPPQWVEIIVAVGMGMLIIGAIVTFGVSSILESIGAFAIGLIIAFTGAILSIIGMISEEKVEPLPTGITQYEVLIDESVNFQEVYDKYEVIERRGDIWVLQDKEIEE